MPHELNMHSFAGKTDKGQKRGVITVLFLFVVGFIFGAISLSMQTGQMIERRIKTDQAADSASYAFASRSAQGLNYMAANNLAIAAASHMTGALHLSADWSVILSTLFMAQSRIRKPGASVTPTRAELDDLGRGYEVLRPISMLYFRSATGLTRINRVVETTFPYIGLLDAVSVAGANSPSAIIIPFRAPRAASTSQSNASRESFMDRVTTALKNTFTGFNPKYEGLSRIRSDETFCLAYKAGKEAVPDWSDVDGWFKGSSLPANLGLNVLGDAVEGVISLISQIGIIANFVGLKVGFSGCGFSDEGTERGGSSTFDKSLISNILLAVLRGPLSGRPMKFELSTGTVNIPPVKSASDLENTVNAMFDQYCNVPDVGKWASESDDGTKYKTPLDLRRGMCVHPDIPPLPPKTRVFKNRDRGFNAGTEFKGDPGDGHQVMFNYKVACLGTVLFGWETYSGLEADVTLDSGTHSGPTPPTAEQLSNKIQRYIPASDTNPLVPAVNVKDDLCPQFPSNDPYGRPALKYPAELPYFEVPNMFGATPLRKYALSHVNMTRSTSFVSPIIKHLSKISEHNGAGWRGGDPRPQAFSKSLKLLGCAAGVPDACTGTDSSGQRFVQSIVTSGSTSTTVTFYPKLETLNWLCPVSAVGSGNPTGVTENLIFANPLDNSRWLASYDPPPEGQTTPGRFLSGYIDLQTWHNDQVAALGRRMECSKYEAYAKGTPVKPHQQGTPGTNTRSHDFCEPGSYMCWQRGMEKQAAAANRDGTLSFTVPRNSGTSPASSSGETELEASLHYATFVANPLRVDNKDDIIGRGDGTPLAHCPPNMDVPVKMEDGTTVPVCDIQPMIGIMRKVINDGNTDIDLDAAEQIGGGDANLATGGVLRSKDGIKLYSMLAISQASVLYQSNSPGNPYSPARPSGNSTATASAAKNYQMFWPSWHPAIEPSRVMSRILPATISPLLED